MIYLTTGANGAGKTLNTLEHVRKLQLETLRTVYYNGFALKPEKAAEFGWLPFNPREWQSLPDGGILICDECQNEFPIRTASDKLPEYVRALSEHRRRGFDFFMVSQHPQNIDVFVRRLIGSPGWHRHLKRAFGADMVSVLEWSAVNATCEKSGAGASARVTMVPFPKHVYLWYDSASLHTGKKSIPRQVYFLVFAALAVPALFYAAFSRMGPKPAAVAAASAGSGVSSVPRSSVQGPVTAAVYMDSFSPRVIGLPHTAPRYDDVTKPVVAPVPAACLAMADRCECYSQQGTRMVVQVSICQQIVKGGFFQDWENARADRSVSDRKPLAGSLGQAHGVVLPSSVLSVPSTVPEHPMASSDASTLAFMAASRGQ